jgi:hypothetical protein
MFPTVETIGYASIRAVVYIANGFNRGMFYGSNIPIFLICSVLRQLLVLRRESLLCFPQLKLWVMPVLGLLFILPTVSTVGCFMVLIFPFS